MRSGLDQRRSAPHSAQISRFESLFFRHYAQSRHIVFECCRTVRQHPAPFELSQFATTLFFARHNLLLALYTLHRCPNFGRWLPSSQIAKTVRACCAVVHIVDNCETGFRFVTPLRIFSMRCAELATNCRNLAPCRASEFRTSTTVPQQLRNLKDASLQASTTRF